MAYSEDDEYIIKLTDAFVEALADGDVDKFELEDLLDIYDYACDTRNEFVRLNVLIVGMNKWPDNVELNERMAVGVFSRGDYDGARTILASVPDDSRLKQMLYASMEYGDKEKIGKQLDKMLEGVTANDKLTDEEVIRLVEVIDMHHLYDWAESRFDKLKKLVEFPDTLMNELIEILVVRDKGEFRKRILEEFVEDYPLLHYSWSQLADYYLKEKADLELAENAVGNALAIEPENYVLRAKFAELMMYSGKNREQARRLVDELYSDYSDKEEAVILKGVFDAFFDGKRESGEQILRKGLKSNPDSVDMLVRLLMITNGEQVEAEIEEFAKHYVPLFDNPDDLETEFDKLRDFGSFRGAAIMGMLIKRLTENADKYYYDDKIAETLYMGGEYGSVVEIYGANDGELVNWPEGLVLIYLLSLKNIGLTEKCSTLIVGLLKETSEWRRTVGSGWKIEDEFEFRGLMGCLSYMKRALAGEAVDERLYNPFVK